MRWLVRILQFCLILAFILDVIISLAGIGAMALRDSYDTNFSPSIVTIVQTNLGLAGAVARLFGSFLYLGLTVLLEVLWTFYQRALAIVASYQMPVRQNY
ncbi:MAG TPA: hypothetical protein VEH07_09020 [Alphaproteobacteria bacterium]|nr:hypothetical protein [Alphaproteobacteria bacterium]